MDITDVNIDQRVGRCARCAQGCIYSHGKQSYIENFILLYWSVFDEVDPCTCVVVF